jgi:photosystem II stability/assembly factor-like uncharacterized protein
MTGVLFSGTDTGWIAGGYILSLGDSSFILKTVDGGKTWFKQYLPGTCHGPYTLDALDGVHVWQSCDFYLHGTTDGVNWRIVSSAGAYNTINDFDFVTQRVGWMAVDADPGYGDIYSTSDGGDTWTYQRSGCLAAGTIFTSFIDPLRGWVVNYSCSSNATEIWNTIDGGAHWGKQLEVPITGDFQSSTGITFVDSTNGWMIGKHGMIYHTSNGGVTGVDNDGETSPARFSLSQNYPNPFNPSTTITYALPVQSYVTLKVFNVLGQQVATLVDGIESPGSKSVRFEGSGLPSGAYFYRLQAGSYSATKMLMIVR